MAPHRMQRRALLLALLCAPAVSQTLFFSQIRQASSGNDKYIQIYVSDRCRRRERARARAASWAQSCAPACDTPLRGTESD